LEALLHLGPSQGDGGLVEELEAGGLRRARITTACGSTAPAAAGGLRTPGLLLDGVWREGRAGMEGEEEAVGGRRSGVWGEGGAVVSGERAAASGRGGVGASGRGRPRRVLFLRASDWNLRALLK